MSSQTRVLAALVAAIFSSSVGADVLWDNNLTPDGFNGRAISPPLFHDMRTADDFVVPEGERWVIQDFHAGIIEDDGWISGDRLDLFVYEHVEGVGPGDELLRVSDTFTKMSTGDQYYGRDAYEYWIEGLDIEFGPGTYWIGLRNPDGNGSGTNYWLTSDGGRDGAGSSTGFFALEFPNWAPEGEGWHHAFQITGVPEPGSLALLGIGAAALIRRRREPIPSEPRGPQPGSSHRGRPHPNKTVMRTERL